jgi:putative peptide zinc metalloprotease protein
MSNPAAIPWMRRPEIIVRPVADNGQHVVKDPSTGTYFNVGEQEAFLLLNLDGAQTAEGICAAFAARFGEPFSSADLRDFLEIIYAQGLLQPAHRPGSAELRNGTAPTDPTEDKATIPAATEALAPPRTRPKQSILSWRKRIFDPDRLLGWLAPRMRICFTRTFLAVSLTGMAVAGLVVWMNWHELLSSFAHALRWQTVLLVWLTLLAVTLCHEFAHGLACKHFGGEVHEIGVLFLFFMPCLYCNVSDSWLFREKSKRLWVTAAGGYCDLCMWTLAVFAWRLTAQNSLPNYLAYVVLSVLGIRVFFNFNPLLRLDGYYFLSDLMEVPNLQQRAQEHFKGHLRGLLWGAARPLAGSGGRFLLLYGMASWLFSLVYLILMFVGFAPFMKDRLGVFGIFLTLLLGGLLMRGFLRGLFGGELRKMFLQRHRRTAFWSAGVGGLGVVLFTLPMDDRANGSFQLRPVVRAEVRAPVAGFLEGIYVDEGSHVAKGVVVARMEVPNLTSKIAQKRAEVSEAEARLRILEAGARPEEIQLQRRRVERAQNWCDQAERHRQRAQEALEEDLGRLERQIDQYRVELEYAENCHARAQKLVASNAIAAEQYEDADKKCRSAKAQLSQVQAQKRARRATGIREDESECARRAKELEEAQAALLVLEAGARPEELDAARALVVRVKEDLRYQEELQEKTLVSCVVDGLVTTPRLSDKIGQYVHEGDVICQVEEPSVLEAEITLSDQEMARVCVGQEVELKARNVPFQSFHAKVDRIAPRVVKGDLNSTVTVYSKLDGDNDELRPGLVGHARIVCGRRSVGVVWTSRLLRLLRTEFL